ncbi:MAG TPA: NADH-quinone oxidoreductase subunit C [Candidatus Thermoplasmatota archaeon]|nr:NADH-quinone oxidoreductase subunit C [Candidatus Thermoplasmatota archaeon]
MALPDSGNVEDYTEAEMMELVKLNETDKAKLTKSQKAAVARYNFRKGKGEAIPFKGSAAAAAAQAQKTEAQTTQGGAAPQNTPGPGDIIALLSPEMQELAGKDPATLTKEQKIALAKAKSQAVRAQAAAGKPAEPDKPKGPTPEELAAQKALGFAHAKELADRFAPALDGWAMQLDKPYAIVKSERILDVVRYLRMEMGFDQIRDLTAADYPPDRLEVVYNLYRHMDRAHIALKCKLPRDPPQGADMPFLPSIASIYPGADWLEREVFDLFGIRFAGHPYMRRLMLPDGWVGYPLRKDYDSKKEQFVGLSESGDDIVSFDSKDGW